MKKIIVIIAAMLLTDVANAGIPLFSAECPNKINVDSDSNGTIRINGRKAKVKKSNANYYEAKGSNLTISVSIESNGVPMVSYTGKRGANGICQVLASKVSGANTGLSSSERAGQGKFDATGNIPCAQNKGQPMTQCAFSVARGSNGSATVVVTRPDGLKRAIFFDKGNAVSADLSQADGNMTFKSSKEADLFKIEAGDERYEIPEAVVFGG